MKQTAFIICISLTGCLGLSAQNILTGLCNMPLSGDSICQQQVEYFSPGAAGDGQVWDFSELELLDEAHIIKFCCDSDSTALFGLESERILKYRPINDSLQWMGFETALQTMDYQQPLDLYPFPVMFGDHTQQSYQGLGNYCQKYILEANGTIETEADAAGVICLSENDTLYNVLRLHQINSSAIRQYLPTDTIIDSLNMKQRIEERYLWFARGYRYPIYETVSVTIYNNLDPVSCQQQAFCTLPSAQMHLCDSINQQVLETDSLEHAHSQQPPIIHYTVSVEGGSLAIHYTLDADATINILICDKMGQVYRREATTGTAGSTATLRMDCHGLKQGIYVLYMNVNGQVYNEKVEL